MTVKDRIKQIVRHYMYCHVGQENAVKSDRIVIDLERLADGKTNYPFRAVVLEVLRDGELPIAAGAKGYFIAETHGECVDYIQYLKNKITGIEKRIELFKKAAGHADIYHEMRGAG